MNHHAPMFPKFLGRFDVRKTSLDLYLFYLEVTKRGGYHQVYCSVIHIVDMVLLYFLYCYNQVLFFRNVFAHIIYVASNQQGLNLAKKMVSVNQSSNLLWDWCPHLVFDVASNMVSICRSSLFIQIYMFLCWIEYILSMNFLRCLYVIMHSLECFLQVDQEKKWGEVVSALKLEGNNETLCAQLEKLYKDLLYKFEILYFYRSPATQTATGSNTG